MHISLAYGRQQLSGQLDSTQPIRILEPAKVTQEKAANELIADALNAPMDSPALQESCKNGDKVVIIVPDKTRKCGADIFLPVLVGRLNATGIPDRDIKVVLATGSHAKHSDAEVENLLGSEIYRRIRVIEHDAHNPKELIYLGETRFGTPVHLNAHVVEADKRIVTGTTVHHYFAGYGGGAKMINPGCAGYETITRNHALTIDAQNGRIHRACRAGVLAGNPVIEDIQDSMKYIRADFALSTILNSEGAIVDVLAGDLIAVHKKSRELVDAIYKVPIQSKADLVIASCGGYPKDINFIQSHKSLQNASLAVKEHGVVVCLAECREGIGSHTFLQWFEFPGKTELLQALRDRYLVNGTTALSLKNKTESFRIIFVSSLRQDLVAKLGLIPAPNLAEALSLAAAFLPEDYSTYVMPNASLTLPYMR